MKKKRVLFICVHNSARSQMAETFLNDLGKDEYEAESAGLEPGTLNPYVVEVMKEIDYDISRNKTKSVLDYFRRSELFSFVITVCDEGNSERCPIFPGPVQRLHWSFPDPSNFSGNKEDILKKTREVRDQILQRIKAWIRENSNSS
ncbi:MAG: arsenate reductase ArsC [Candidatus Cloacimonetes bacterium]|nr:arsenate reductase ArsC [Candidatus Cloacimonadota bacterium]